MKKTTVPVPAGDSQRTQSQTETESDFARRKSLQQEVIASIKHFRASDRLERDAVHRRDVNR